MCFLLVFCMCKIKNPTRVYYSHGTSYNAVPPRFAQYHYYGTVPHLVFNADLRRVLDALWGGIREALRCTAFSICGTLCDALYVPNGFPVIDLQYYKIIISLFNAFVKGDFQGISPKIKFLAEYLKNTLTFSAFCYTIVLCIIIFIGLPKQAGGGSLP